AAQSNADVGSIRSNYATALGHQGAAFASSLPMTLAGGMLGRVGANAVLGRGYSLTDVATGKVTLADIRRNTNGLMDAIHPSQPKALITDLDNTLFPLPNYLAPSLR